MDLIDYTGQQYLEESSALNTSVYIADYFDVETFPTLPVLTGNTNGSFVDLGDSVFVMKEGKKFHQFLATMEKNAFSSNLVGARGAKSFENMLTIGKSGSDKDLFGFLRANRNKKLVVAFKFLGATQFCIMGYHELPAEVDSASLEVPAEIAGEKMTSMVIRSIFHVPYFIDAIPLTPAPAPAE
jgi:hypothetical protein